MSPPLLQSEIIRGLLARPSAPPESSVSLSRNAKGATQVEVTVRAANATDADALAQEIYDTLVAKYPYPASGSELQASPTVASEPISREEYDRG